jgi:hypothetical protein
MVGQKLGIIPSRAGRLELARREVRGARDLKKKLTLIFPHHKAIVTAAGKATQSAHSLPVTVNLKAVLFCLKMSLILLLSYLSHNSLIGLVPTCTVCRTGGSFRMRPDPLASPT